MIKKRYSPGVSPHLICDKALSVGVSPPPAQNNERTSAAETEHRTGADAFSTAGRSNRTRAAAGLCWDS